MWQRFTMTLLALGLAALWPLSASAENSVSVGDYDIHYSALSTADLQPETAKRYGIRRSKSRALLNVVVLKKVMGTTGQPVTAEVSASAINLNSQYQKIPMKEVLDGGAVYYLGTVKVNHGDTLTFTIEARPEGQGKPYKVKFQQQFFTD